MKNKINLIKKMYSWYEVMDDLKKLPNERVINKPNDLFTTTYETHDRYRFVQNQIIMTIVDDIIENKEVYTELSKDESIKEELTDIMQLSIQIRAGFL